MCPIYDYYELVISLSNSCNQPLCFVAAFKDKKNLVKIKFSKGLFSSIDFSEWEGCLGLDDNDKQTVRKILELNLNPAIKKWIDFHLYGKSIAVEIIKSKV